MNENYNLKLKDIYSESLVRDIVLFFFLFMLVLAQKWDNILLLLFPLISFSFAIFFKIIDIIKKRREGDNSQIIYNPLGNEKKHANRLVFCALLQLILLFWFGAESLYHPQLVDNYYIYFISIFIFFYTFGFYWMFLDLWKYSRIEILKEGIEVRDSQIHSKNIENVVSFLKMKNFKIISLISLLIFIILNLLNVFSAILIHFGYMPGINYTLPGSGIEESDPISISFFIYGIIAISPSASIIFLFLNYRDINNINKEKFNKIIDSLPKDVKNKIIENLETLNKKLKFILRLE
ncbi:MAG: hypothetical protein EU540_04355 [Promethearchaeota archaeon]|nr:MAG: hypothetical protein EU540_04355 [Candidatus Lokiarchaeota archaeon]